MSRIRVGLIGYGRMGAFYLSHMQAHPEWEIVSICDTSAYSRKLAAQISPTSRITENEDDIFNDDTIDVVCLTALADSRKRQIAKAVAAGKHVISEKPISDTTENEWKSVHLTENTHLLATVNLYLRNSWYHRTIKSFIQSGEIGELAIIRICHLTPGLAPTEGHPFEGPSFHDCGMHYVDIARWYAESEYKQWNSQAVKMWNYEQPWWLQCHGTFQNGVVFDITQGHNYGQLSQEQTHNSYIDIIGTKGVARMSHNFKTAVVELHGITKTQRIEKPYGDKNIDVMCDLFGRSIRQGELDATLPTMRDSAIASEYAWKFYNNALGNDLPSVGTLDTLDEILERRRTMENGYGIIRKQDDYLINIETL
ncbi:MAG: Gfo/Idh/MocA family protein [Phocaeicola sp.]